MMGFPRLREHDRLTLMRPSNPKTLPLVMAGMLALACEADPGLSTEEKAAEPCRLGDVKPCTCPDGNQRTSVCGGDGFFMECACGPHEPGVPVRPESPEPDAEPAAPPTRPPRPRDAANAPPDAESPPPDARVEPSPVDASVPPPDAEEAPPIEPDAAAPGPAPGCPGEPSSVRVGAVDIFRYEASHPEATDRAAFPGAQSAAGGPPFDGSADACSRAGVRPWHTISGPEARGACERIGWRLCSAQELTVACGGPDRFDWTFGSEFDGGACNLRQVYTAPGAAATSEAPTGAFPRCVSEAGVFDLTGNLWEWADDTITYQGGGWRILAEHHRESDLVCAAGVRAAADFRGPDVGFRCCRDAP
jgi:hypothetical protein